MFYKHVLISFPNKSQKNMSIWVFKIQFLKWDSITQNNGHFADMFIAITQQQSKIYIYWLEIWWAPGVVITTNVECKKQIVNCIEHQKSKNWTNTVF
jgi:hypothetical protein